MTKKIRLFAATLAITFAAIAFGAIITHMNNYNTAKNALRLLHDRGNPAPEPSRRHPPSL